MILPFSTQINGKPTYFVQKIWRSIKEKNYIKDFIDETPSKYLAPLEITKKLKPKFHTIREDKKNRWKAGVLIDFFINARKKGMFRFAPRIPVVSTQKIKIKYFNFYDNYNKKAEVYVDDCFLGQYYFNKVDPNGEEELIKLAQNDGFDSVDDFFEYFNKDFKGKLIHWTNLRY